MSIRKSASAIAVVVALAVVGSLIVGRSSLEIELPFTGRSNPTANEVIGALPAPDGAAVLSDGSFVTPTDFSTTLFDEATGMAFIPNQIIIDAVAGVDPQDVAVLVNADGAEVVSFDEMMRLYQVEFTRDTTFAELTVIAERWHQSELIAAAGINEVFPISTTATTAGVQSGMPSQTFPPTAATPGQNVTWGLDAINAPEAWALLAEHGIGKGEGVVVGVLDGAMKSGLSNVPIGTVYGYQPETDDTWHGVHVAGTIGGRGGLPNGQLFGVASDVSLVGAIRDSQIPAEICEQLWESIFTGRFRVIEKVNDYEYVLVLAELNYLNHPPGSSRVETVDGVQIQVTVTEPYGIADAQQFRLFLPGRSTAGLSDEFKTWVGVWDWDTLPDPNGIPFMALINELDPASQQGSEQEVLVFTGGWTVRPESVERICTSQELDEIKSMLEISYQGDQLIQEIQRWSRCFDYVFVEIPEP